MLDMTEYAVWDESGRRIIHGDTVTDFRGDQAIFDRVTRGELPGKSAKVTVTWPGNRGEFTRGEYYAQVFNLRVERIHRDPKRSPATK